ncbi:MAG: protein kinase, partial [Acidobacteriota bacterium]
SGRAKILDFGLAKRLDGEAEASLTRSTAVVGTFRSMSPEQARGMPLDHTSDLFSFGILLYEMLTGVSPFKAGSAPETLMRICTARQVPARELRPEIPEGLSSLIDHLLEKDPAFRPQGAGKVASILGDLAAHLGSAEEQTVDSCPTVQEAREAQLPAKGRRLALVLRRRGLAALLVLAAGAALLALLLLRTREEVPLYVAVTQPDVPAGADERVKLNESALRFALIDALLGYENVFPLAPDQVDEVTASPLQAARTLGAGELISSRLTCGAEICEAVLSRVRSADGGLLWTTRLEAPVERPNLFADAVRA